MGAEEKVGGGIFVGLSDLDFELFVVAQINRERKILGAEREEFAVAQKVQFFGIIFRGEYNAFALAERERVHAAERRRDADGIGFARFEIGGNRKRSIPVLSDGKLNRRFDGDAFFEVFRGDCI